MTGPFGFLIIDKPQGLSSHDCVNRVRKLFGTKQVGHGGTLDPAVTGVLPIALGHATRLLPYLPSDKTYRGIIQLGKKTTTDDLQGKTISTHPWPSLDHISLELHLDEFRGAIHQHPPHISSVHIDGERAYKRVRRGEIVDLPKRTITIHELLLLDWDQNIGQVKINVHCSSGTYIRALARDLGDNIGCGGCLASLRRTQALGFQEKQSLPLPKVGYNGLITLPKLITPLNALLHLPRVQINSTEELLRWRTGCQLSTSNKKLNPATKFQPSEHKEHIVVLDPTGEVIGIANKCGDSLLQPKVVFNALG